MFSKNDFNTFSHVNDFAALVGTEGLLNVYNNKDANFTWYGKLIKSAVDYANQRKIVIQSVNDGNQEFEEILYLQFSDSGVSIDSYYHTMIGNKTMKELNKKWKNDKNKKTKFIQNSPQILKLDQIL